MKTCPNCRTGALHPRTIDYANWHSGQYVVVPNLPAWSCDVCALCQIDVEALQRLLPLIGPVTRPDFTQTRHPVDGQVSINDWSHDDPDRDRRAA
jgi:YgiT-type zinc finger domain-containing protein